MRPADIARHCEPLQAPFEPNDLISQLVQAKPPEITRDHPRT